MPRVHRVEEIERFASADLSDDDAIRRHPKRLVDEHLDRDRTTTLRVWRAALQRNTVAQLAPQMELRLVFDGDHALIRRDHPREHSHERGLSGPSATCYQDVQSSGHRSL